MAERVDSRRSGEPESLLDGQKEPQSDVGRATSTCGEVLMLPIPKHTGEVEADITVETYEEI